MQCELIQVQDASYPYGLPAARDRNARSKLAPPRSVPAGLLANAQHFPGHPGAAVRFSARHSGGSAL
jgi:hypothetical protein